MVPFFKKLMIALAAFFMAILLCEVLLRFFWDNPYQKTHPAMIVELRLLTPLLNRTLNREWLDATEKEVLFHTDSRGYILPVNQFPNPDFTIAFLGGSTTECRYVRDDLRFPALTSALLKDEGFHVNILNAARSGNTSHDSINKYFNHVVLDRPDIVVMMHAINDHGVLAKDANYATRSGQIVDARKQIKWLLLDMSTKSSLFGLFREIEYWLVPREVGMLTSSMGAPIDSAPFIDRLETFVTMVRSFGAVPVLMTQPLAEARTELTPEWADTFNQRRFNDAIRDVAASMNVPLVDIEQRLATVPDFVEDPIKYLYDGIHVTDAGSVFYAQEIASILTPLIQDMRILASHEE
jgi:lysophospholipase L1-like esterase